MWSIIVFLYFITAVIGFILSLTMLPSLGSRWDHVKYMLAGLFWPIYLVMRVFGYRLSKEYYLPCPALDEWREGIKRDENNNAG